MKNILFTLTLLGCLASTSIAQGIQFEKGTWDEIKAKAKAANKHIFVDAYTTWCGPCKWQSKKVFPQKEVGDFFNKNFVSFKMDMEKGEGVAFAKKYEIQAFPTLLYFDSRGEIVHRTSGANPAKKLIEQAKEALNPKTQFYAQKRRFEQGERDQKFLKQYATTLKSLYLDFSKPRDLYLNQLGKSKWATAEGWDFIKELVDKSSLEAFEYVTKHKDQFVKVANGKEAVDKFILKVIMGDMAKVAQSKNLSKLTAFKKKLSTLLEDKTAKKKMAQVDYMFYLENKEKALEYATKYMSLCDNPGELIFAASFFSDRYPEPDYLMATLQWIDKVLKIEQHFAHYSLKAKILVKTENYQDAKKAAEEALKLAKKGSKQYVKMIQKQLDEINAKL